MQYVVPNRNFFEAAELVDTVLDPGPGLEFVGLVAPAAGDEIASAVAPSPVELVGS